MKFFKVLALSLFAIGCTIQLNAAVYTVTSGGSSGPGTLYEAIQNTNLHKGPDTVNFDLQDVEPPYFLSIAFRMPTLTDNGTFINGYSQEGSNPSNGGFGEADDASILLVLEGSAVDSQYAALTIESDSNEICGLIISRINGSDITSGGSGILINGGSYNHVWGCWLGLDTTGSADWGSRQAGVVLRNGASHNLIGGVTPAERNVISGNNVSQIAVLDRNSDDNEIRGNFIGTDRTGTKKPGNLTSSGYGIYMEGDAADSPERTLIGGPDSLSANIISANPQDGIYKSGHLWPAGLISNNRIGVDAGGNSLGNGGSGIVISKNVAYDTIANNWIAYNGSHGIMLTDTSPTRIYIRQNSITDNEENGIILTGLVTTCKIENCDITRNAGAGVFLAGPKSDFNTITRNSIYDNGGIGIDIAPEGFNLNDGSDVDEGANEQMNFPVIDSVSTTRAYGHIEGYSRRICTVEVFVAAQDESKYGEGKIFIGSGLSDAEGKFVIVTAPSQIGDYITTTATDTAGNTSEFSKDLRVSQVGPGVRETRETEIVLLDVMVSSRALEVEYLLSKTSDLTLSLYDASGVLVRESVEKGREQGRHSVLWNTCDLASGVYFVRFETAGQVLMRKTVLVR